MKAFNCEVCGQLVFFENTLCTGCGRALGYLPDLGTLSALEAAGGAHWRALARPESPPYRMCQNYHQQQVCNWMLPAADPADLCLACRLNETIPDLSQPGHHERWRRIETAKRRMLYGLLSLGLLLPHRGQSDVPNLAFAFLADSSDPNGDDAPALTGHADGLISLNIAEADDAERERRRLDMGEPYRTLLGHLRHEIGHYYWDLLVRDSAHLALFRELFGDEQADYGEALSTHYQQGAAPDWQQHYISAYASAHPWEDWAETFAHYLHIVDTLETAREFGVRARPPVQYDGHATAGVSHSGTSYRPTSARAMVAEWLPLTYAINSINRSMGQPDLYPFVLPPAAIAKLELVHGIIASAAGHPGAAAGYE